MKSTDANQIIQDLTLNKPTAAVKSVEYDWDTNVARIGVLFQEENANYKHMRFWNMDTNGQNVTADEVETFIRNELVDFE